MGHNLKTRKLSIECNVFNMYANNIQKGDHRMTYGFRMAESQKKFIFLAILKEIRTSLMFFVVV